MRRRTTDGQGQTEMLKCGMRGRRDESRRGKSGDKSPHSKTLRGVCSSAGLFNAYVFMVFLGD